MKSRIRPGAASLSGKPREDGPVNDAAQGRTVIYLCRWPFQRPERKHR